MDALKFTQHQKNANWDYDSEADVLYVYFDNPKNAEGVDIGNGTIIRVDPETNEIVGFTILNPIQKTLDQLSATNERK